MNYIYGRYALAAVWYKTITGNSVAENAYIPITPFAPDEKVDMEALRVVKDTIEGSREKWI